MIAGKTVLSVAAEIAAKAALLCLAAALVHVVAGRRRILLRSATWHVCLLGLAILPLTVVALPRLPIAIWDQPANRELHRTAAAETLDTTDLVGEIPDPSENPDLASYDEPASFETRAAMLPQVAGTSRGSIGRSAATALGLVYLLVVLGLLIRLASSFAAVARLRRSSVELADPAWQTARDRWQRILGLRTYVEVRQTSAVSVPIVVGWLKPVILVPAEMSQSAARQAIDAVLVHELTHVGRGDYAWNLLLRFVEALYWPHPCVWLAARKIRQVREEVCDAMCVHCLQDAREYCAILVEVASGLATRSQVALGMAMTRSSELGRRLERVVASPPVGRFVLGGRSRATLAAAVLISTALLGMLSTASRVSAGVDSANPIHSKERDRQDQGARTLNSDANDPIAPTDSDYPAKSRDGRSHKPDKAVDSGPVRVHTARVTRGKLYKTITAVATLEAFEPVSVRSRVAGIAVKVAVDEGDLVQRGDLLAVIDVPDLEAALAQDEADLDQAKAGAEQAQASLEAAEASLEAAEAMLAESVSEMEGSAASLQYAQKQFDRLKSLAEAKAIDEKLVNEREEKLSAAKSERSAADAKVQTNRANIARAKAELRVAKAVTRAALLKVKSAEVDLQRSRAMESYREIRAPLDGVVVSRHVEADAPVKPGDDRPLFTIATVRVITAAVQIPEREAARVKRGALASAYFQAVDWKPVPGKVNRVAYGIDRATGTMAVQVTLANPDGILKPGMSGQVSIAIGEVNDVLSIPQGADGFPSMTDDKGNILPACWRVVDGRAVHTPITTGTIDEVSHRVEVTKGLKEGDEVISFISPDDAQRLQDGDPVEVIREK